VRDSCIVVVQTMISNEFGASVGMEAGYTQAGSAFASRLGRFLRVRRTDMRTLVGCGAAGAIAAAFDAPLTGAFYAFELIIAAYTIGTLAPVVVASIPVLRRPLHTSWRCALTESDIVGPALAAEDIFYDTSLGPSIAPTVRRLADLAPRTLALMHGSSCAGDTAAALRDLASAYDKRLRAAVAEMPA
jgi:hypothetical protein